MKDAYAIGLGVAGFALGCAVVAVYEADKVKTMDNKLTDIFRGIGYIQNNIDLEVPEEVAKAMVRNAAQNVANEAVIKATDSAVKEIKKDINNQVKTAVKDAYKSVEGDVKHHLESQINMQTIDKIQNAVSEKVAKQIMDRSLFIGSSGSSKDALIKTCIENGMDAWEIRRILEASK